MLPPGPLLARGLTAEVYDVGDGRVLRRYRPDGHVHDATREAAVMTWVARHGVPVPTVHDASGADLVMEHVPGPTLLAELEHGQVAPAQVAAVLVDLHRRLHAVPALPIVAQGPGWPATADPPPGAETEADVVVHMDLHPSNVIVGPAGPVIIDWPNARAGTAGLDVAMTLLILGESASEPAHRLAPLTGAVIAGMLSDLAAPSPAEQDRALVLRLADPYLGADAAVSSRRSGAFLETMLDRSR